MNVRLGDRIEEKSKVDPGQIRHGQYWSNAK